MPLPKLRTQALSTLHPTFAIPQLLGNGVFRCIKLDFQAEANACLQSKSECTALWPIEWGKDSDLDAEKHDQQEDKATDGCAEQ